MRVDLLVSAVIFFSSSFLGFYSYNEIKTQDRPNDFSIKGISTGKTHYAIKQNEQCRAWFNTDFNLTPEITLTYNGAFKVNYESNEYLTELKGWLFFNAFSQLVHAELNINFADIKIEITANNTNPVEVSVVATSLQANIRRDFQLPGPIIIKNSLGKYFLDLSFIARSLRELPLGSINFQTIFDQNFEVINDPLVCIQPKDLEKTWELDKIETLPFDILGLIK